jgi:arylsulfatase A-like enzyme
VRRADELLGALMRKYDDTLLVLMPDGAPRWGWHGIQQEESWRLPFAAHRPGIAKGRTVAYAENIDVALTIAALMGREARALTAERLER